MKHFFASVILLLASATANAKISDFNEIIQENSKNQKQLHSEVKNQILEVKKDIVELSKADRTLEIQSVDGNYVVPLKKDFLVYEKEKNYHRHSENKQLKRIANEISNINQD